MILAPLACGGSDGGDDGGFGETTGGSGAADTGGVSSTATTQTPGTHGGSDADSAADGSDGPADGSSGAADGSDSGTPGDSTGGGSGPGALPPPDGGLDYQLGGAYPPPEGVTIVSRDRNADPAPGIYNICYVNGFQAQPDEESFWLDDHPDLVLRDGGGDPVIDQDWNEMLLDTSTDEKRTALAEIVGGWISGCKDAGFDAIEIDNLDSYSRSQGLLTENDNVAAMALFSAAAHDLGLAIAQKNSSEIVGRRDEMGTDFVVAEECNRYEECDVYLDAYAGAVLMIEYRQMDFASGCDAYAGQSIVLRDVDLVPAGEPGYVYDAC